MHWNLMNEKEFESIKLLKLNYRRGDQILGGKSTPDPRNEARSIEAIQLFCKIGFPTHPLKLSPLLNLREFQKTGEK